jgi:YidC/Oxa1 family membrane protein insertase
MYPLTIKQLHTTKAMQEMQPRLFELQKKYGKDRAKFGQEQMKLYKEAGISPVGCAIPMLIQLPVWIALYQSIMMALAVAPEGLLNLSRYLYSWAMVYSQIPLENSFMWLNLAVPDNLMILPLLVGITMWVTQKMVTPTGVDPRQQAQNRLMLWMMPLMFTFFSLQFPSGLALYWVTSNIISIVIQYFVTGWGGLIKARPTTETKKIYSKRTV